MTRYGKDVINSWHKFVDNTNPAFRKMWGGFPPPNPTFNETFAFFVPNEVALHRAEYCKTWWALKDRDDVLFLHYADLIREPESTIRKIGEFIGVSDKIPENKWASIVETCSLKGMKAIQERFYYAYNPKAGVDTAIKKADEAIIGKGGTGAYKAFFTDYHHKAYDEAMKEMIPDEEMRAWCEFGNLGHPQ